MDTRPLHEPESSSHGDEEMEHLPGFVFHPTDEELITFYLRGDLQGFDHIPRLNVYAFDPWDLSKMSPIGAFQGAWYFFSTRNRKYRNSARPNRVALSGYWKATGTDRPICSSAGSPQCIGYRKSLVFYCGKSSNGKKTDWMMHEFRLPDTILSNNADTICKIWKKHRLSLAAQSPVEVDKDCLPDGRMNIIIGERPKKGSFHSSPTTASDQITSFSSLSTTIMNVEQDASLSSFPAKIMPQIMSISSTSAMSLHPAIIGSPQIKCISSTPVMSPPSADITPCPDIDPSPQGTIHAEVHVRPSRPQPLTKLQLNRSTSTFTLDDVWSSMKFSPLVIPIDPLKASYFASPYGVMSADRIQAPASNLTTPSLSSPQDLFTLQLWDF